jgi:hypothetical protein
MLAAKIVQTECRVRVEFREPIEVLLEPLSLGSARRSCPFPEVLFESRSAYVGQFRLNDPVRRITPPIEDIRDERPRFPCIARYRLPARHSCWRAIESAHFS